MNIIGENGLPFFIGVVEDREDPDKMGRVRVRMFGYHTSDVSEIPTEGLPWCMTAVGAQNPTTNGIGLSANGLMVGTWVIGVFLSQGAVKDNPLVLGALPSLVDGISTLSGLATSEIDRTDIQSLKDTVDKNVSNASGVSPDGSVTKHTWNEKETDYNAVYPFNKAYESESGHIIEVDDTPDAERLRIKHKSGTQVEYHTDGSKVSRVKLNNIEIIEKDNNVHIKGASNITVEGDCNLTVNGNQTTHIKGNKYEKIEGGYILSIAGNSNQSVGGSKQVDITGSNKVFAASQLHTALSSYETVGGSINYVYGGIVHFNPAPKSPTTPITVKKDS